MLIASASGGFSANATGFPASRSKRDQGELGTVVFCTASPLLSAGCRVQFVRVKCKPRGCGRELANHVARADSHLFPVGISVAERQIRERPVPTLRFLRGGWNRSGAGGKLKRFSYSEPACTNHQPLGRSGCKWIVFEWQLFHFDRRV